MKLLIDNLLFVSADELRLIESFPSKYKQNIRHLVKDYNISKDKYSYIFSNDRIHKISDEKNKKAKLFFEKEYFNNTLKKIFEITFLPRILLKEEEKIVLNGVTHDLVLRGTRTVEGLFISIISVGKMFGVRDLCNDILKTKKENEDYVYLNVKITKNDQVKIQRHPYFTYDNFVEYTFVSRKPNAKELRTKFTKILLVHQFGTLTQKKKLAKKLLGASVDEMKNVLKRDSSPVSCIYLLAVGLVKDLRSTMNIDSKYNDNMIVCKYGKTIDMERRIQEHSKTFSKYECNISVIYYSRVDSSACSKAESFIKNYINSMKLNFSFGKMAELAIMDKKTLDTSMKDHFFSIERTFCVENKDLVNQIKNLENENKLLKIENENKLLKIENEKKNLENENKLLKANHKAEILELKLQQYESKKLLR